MAVSFYADIAIPVVVTSSQSRRLAIVIMVAIANRHWRVPPRSQALASQPGDVNDGAQLLTQMAHRTFMLVAMRLTALASPAFTAKPEGAANLD